ncbi:hypothetical protein EVAR_69402_1 [Eumeta japonica]|uniref:Uncharacterized protein n=1 Tax=Eumeta variegata TaxID=151549 RepID=A0A4C1ZYP7_EUMVA|nr:hypothetical protein EVAR_69402_1 [Eumeta japonica]
MHQEQRGAATKRIEQANEPQSSPVTWTKRFQSQEKLARLSAHPSRTSTHTHASTHRTSPNHATDCITVVVPQNAT